MQFAPENFQDYVGAVMGVGLDPESLAVVVVMRYHADESGAVHLTKPEIAAAAKLGRTTAFQRLSGLEARKFVRTLRADNRGSVYQLATPDEIRSAVREMDGIVRAANGIVRAADGIVRAADGMSSRGERQDHIGSSSCYDVATELQEQQAAAAAAAPAPTHVHTREAMPLPAAPVETAPTPDFEAIVREWMSTQNGRSPDRQAAIAPWNVTVTVKALVDKHGPQRVRDAIKAATLKTNQGAPSLAFLTRLLDEGIHDPARTRQTQAGGYQPAAYKSENGVATPRELPEGEW